MARRLKDMREYCIGIAGIKNSNKFDFVIESDNIIYLIKIKHKESLGTELVKLVV